MSTFQILHLSDLHVSAQGNFDRSVVLDPLIIRLKEDLEKGFQPEIVIMSGDIAFSGKPEEYELTKKGTKIDRNLSSLSSSLCLCAFV